MPRRATHSLRPLLLAAVAAFSVGTALLSQAQTQIPATFVLPSGTADTSQPGFIWRVHQVATLQPNDNTRTENQLAGLLGDNLANPAAAGAAIAPASPASPATAPIRFDIMGVLNLSLNGTENQGNFLPDGVMPGIPGTTGSYDSVAAEILTWLDLPAGIITMGVNSDDGFRMTLGGATPIDKFAPKVGEFNGGRGARDTLFEISVAQAGLYALRCTWEQGRVEANLELFTMRPDGTRVLVNDIANGGIPAYRSVTTPNRAYARHVSPAPNVANAQALTPIVVELVDGAFPISAASTSLTLDGVVVPVTRAKSGAVTTVSHVPTVRFAAGSQHAVVFSYLENNALVQVPWNFTVVPRIGPNGHVYEVVLVEGGITWPNAKAAAESMGNFGAVSHLATITSFEEDLFLERLRQASPPNREDGQLWVGGFQKKDSPDFSEPYGGWIWLNNEGPISWYNWGYPYYTYANWYPGEPNNARADQGSSEDYLAIGLFNSFGWNDDGFYADGRLDGTLGGYIVEYEPIQLLVDIKPGDTKNAVNLVSNGKLPVAVLSKPNFDATQLDVASIRFGRTGTETAPVSWSKQDVNGDRRLDLVLHFVVQDTELICDDTAAVMTAQTLSRFPAQGRDTIQVVGCPHYSLTATALLDVNKVADLELVVQSLKNDAITPAVASQVQLKSFDAVGKLRWTKNIPSVPLQQWSSSYSQGNVQASDALPHQPIKVKALVPDSTGKNTEVLYTETVVKLRPDLAVENILLPTSAEACQVVNVVATIRELNGDMGASALAYLYDGDQAVDAAWVWIEPRGSADVVFSRVFGQSGPHTLKVVVSDVSPGDYDASNNISATANIEIGQRPISPVSYYAGYNRRTFETQSESQNPYYSFLYRESGKTESLYASFFLTPFLKFPFQDVTIQLSADGVVKENYQLGPIDADYVYSDGGNYYEGTAFRQLGNVSTNYLYLRAYSYGGGCSDAVTADIYRSAADTVYHSEFHDYYWGTSIVDDHVNQSGTFLDAASSLEIGFVLRHDAGVFGGTTGPIPVYGYPFNYEWNYEYPDWGFDRGYNRGEEFFGYGYGELTP